MPLPILQHHPGPTDADLLRLFLQTDNRWMQHCAEESLLDVGLAYTNPALDQVHDANHVRDVALPEGMSVDAALAEVDAHFARAGSRCAYWTFNVSAPEERTRPLIERLTSTGCIVQTMELLLLHRAAPESRTVPTGLKIIPARASFRHTRQHFDDLGAERGRPAQVTEARMMHLDDPHWDALLALKDSEPVAYLGVFSAGEVGRIEHVTVVKKYRRLGIGRHMMHRAIEICARAAFKHVMLSTLAQNAPALALYEQLGFRRVAQYREYYSPWTADRWTHPLG